MDESEGCKKKLRILCTEAASPQGYCESRPPLYGWLLGMETKQRDGTAKESALLNQKTSKCEEWERQKLVHKFSGLGRIIWLENCAKTMPISVSLSKHGEKHDK
ncbi:hypothetical protein OS493_001746 [Desmophyllum pertusum]|uniref:Uncharacterized protein n=1 Tax=Desmophyllum pertusum TaxID=174260 RepID=A0A9W9Z4L7_9CNID|nr:hypothetical protein OS493_001746 [Desmophyllum pertusum]